MKPRFYLKSELAHLYFPGVSTSVATRNLRRWILQAPQLREQLNAAGALSRSKYFTCHQVELIIDHFGHP